MINCTRMPNKNGFTLVELVVSIALSAVVLAGAVKVLDYNRDFMLSEIKIGLFQSIRAGVETVHAR